MIISATALSYTVSAAKCYQSVYAGDPKMQNPLQFVELRVSSFTT
jgi:hypothetical protein